MIFSKKTILLAGILLGSVLEICAAPPRRARITREEYIDKYKSIAIAHMERYGIPASITMAQGILESDCGNAWLAQASNNHFGIKCKKDWKGRKVYHDDDAANECFRAYPSVEASYRDHAEFLDRQPRYDFLFSFSTTDYKSWAHGLKKAGYATNPKYAELLIKIIEESKLYLLDKEDGERQYASAQQHDEKSEEYFSQNSTVNEKATQTTTDPDNYRVTINAHGGYNVYRTNNIHYVLAKENDTFENIGQKFRVSARNLRKFNEIKDRKAQPLCGEIVYIERKRKHWHGDNRTHTCVNGETTYSISQSYGIRQKNLEKMNRLKTGSQLHEGQTLKIK